MDNNKTWEALSMKDRASFIKLAMQNGYRNLDSIRNLYNDSNKFDSGGPTNDYNAVLYNGEITVPIEEIPIIGKSNLTEYKPGDKRYIDQIRKFTDRIYKGELTVDAVPKYYQRGVENTIKGDQFANKVIKSRDENYRVLRNAMNALPLAIGAQAILPAIPIDKVEKGVDTIKHIGKVAMNPAAAKTEAGAIASTLFDATGTAYGLDQNIDLLGKAIKGDATWEDTVNFGLNTLSLVPYTTAFSKGLNIIKPTQSANSINKTPIFGSIDNNSDKRKFEIFNNLTNNNLDIQSIYYKSPLYKFLHSPSKIGTYLLNKNFPEADRIKIWNQVVDYNNNQRLAFGYEPLNLPYNKDVIKAADRIDDFLNLFGLQKFVTGRGRAAAWASGEPINIMDIRFSSPYLWNGNKHSIIGTTAHELRHGIQNTFDYERPTIFMQNQPRFNDFALPRELRGRGLSPAAQILFNSKFTPNRTNWMKSLNEFDADMAKHRYKLDLNIPYHEWDIEAKQMAQKSLAQRFGISPIEADAIAYDLSTHGYALGGPLYNEDNPIEGFQGNPYIPIVRY
jgi:hypothetical protein